MQIRMKLKLDVLRVEDKVLPTNRTAQLPYCSFRGQAILGCRSFDLLIRSMQEIVRIYYGETDVLQGRNKRLMKR